MWVWCTWPWWNREVQITQFVKQRIPAQLHSEADALKDGQIRPHIRQPYPTGAGYENLARFRPGSDMISGATLVTIHVCDRWTDRQNYNSQDCPRICSCCKNVNVSESSNMLLLIMKMMWMSVILNMEILVFAVRSQIVSLVFVW